MGDGRSRDTGKRFCARMDRKRKQGCEKYFRGGDIFFAKFMVVFQGGQVRLEEKLLIVGIKQTGIFGEKFVEG